MSQANSPEDIRSCLLQAGLSSQAISQLDFATQQCPELNPYSYARDAFLNRGDWSSSANQLPPAIWQNNNYQGSLTQYNGVVSAIIEANQVGLRFR
jgi:hypothetical protein